VRSTGLLHRDGLSCRCWPTIIIAALGANSRALPDLTYGNATGLPWSWNYGDGVARHPTALYEILGSQRSLQSCMGHIS